MSDFGCSICERFLVKDRLDPNMYRCDGCGRVFRVRKGHKEHKQQAGRKRTG